MTTSGVGSVPNGLAIFGHLFCLLYSVLGTLKPANIWLESSPHATEEGQAAGRVKILDFGLARVGGDDTPLTQAGAILGSAGYMAPEQIEGRTVDARCDLFSLGCLLYRCATGLLPFQGTDLASALYAAVTKDPQPPRELNPTLTPTVSDFILRLLSKDSAGRPNSAREVAEILRELDSEPLVMSPSGPAGRTDAATAPGRRWLQRSRVRMGAVVAIMIAVLGTLTYLYGGVVIDLTTNHGRLVIQSNDPDLQVKITQDGVVIRDASRDREFRLKPGNYDLEVVEEPVG